MTLRATKPKALYILSPGAFSQIYGPEDQQRIDALVEMVAPPQTTVSVAERPELLAEVEIIFSGWGAPRMDAAFLANAPALKAVFYGAGSVRGMVTDALWARDIVVTSSWGANGIPVAEFTEAQIVLSLKRFWHHLLDGWSTQGRSRKTEVPGGYHSTVGLISLGMIGRLVAQRLRSHDLRVLAYDPFVSQEQADAAGLRVTMVGLNDLFEQSDVVSLHTPNLPETRKMIRGEHFRRMKPNATFLNTARGAVVDEEALIDVFRARTDLYALLDVTFPEPPPADSPLYRLPNVLLTPHIAGSMGGECHRMAAYAIDECRRYLAGEPLQWQVTRERAATMA